MPFVWPPVGSFSGALNVPNRYAETGSDMVLKLDHIFPERDKIIGSDADLYALCGRVAQRGKPLPQVYLSCGTKDHLYQASVDMRTTMEQAGYTVEWDEADYGHEWRFWDEQVEKFLKWIKASR